MKLTYWIAHCTNDSPCYSLRGKTRKAVKALRIFNTWEDGTCNFSEPEKVVVQYDDAFDLLAQCNEEGGIDEGNTYF